MVKDTIKAGGKKYHLHTETGKVVNSSKTTSTSVSGGGNYAVNSFSTINDQIFLVDKTGKEHSLQLTDFDVACREGNVLTVIWAIPKGKDRGQYVALRNHTTEQTFFGDRILYDMCLRRFSIRTLLAVCVIVGWFFGFSLIAAITLGPLVGIVVSMLKRERQAKRESEHLKVELEKIINEIKV